VSRLPCRHHTREETEGLPAASGQCAGSRRPAPSSGTRFHASACIAATRPSGAKPSGSGRIVSGAGGRTPSELCGRVALKWRRHCSTSTLASCSVAEISPAWIRTAPTTASLGVGLVRFLRSRPVSDTSAESVRLHEGAFRFGTSLVVLGIGATLPAGGLHLHTPRRLRENRVPALTRWPLSVTVALLVAVAGRAGPWSVLGR
jgi:uncharacterized membrane protein YidH (DUF202 family)